MRQLTFKKCPDKLSSVLWWVCRIYQSLHHTDVCLLFGNHWFMSCIMPFNFNRFVVLFNFYFKYYASPTWPTWCVWLKGKIFITKHCLFILHLLHWSTKCHRLVLNPPPSLSVGAYVDSFGPEVWICVGCLWSCLGHPDAQEVKGLEALSLDTALPSSS